MFEYAMSLRARSEVKSQNLPSKPAFHLLGRIGTAKTNRAISHSESL